jgi:NADPH-dependent curcumin reductase CurA
LAVNLHLTEKDPANGGAEKQFSESVAGYDKKDGLEAFDVARCDAKQGIIDFDGFWIIGRTRHVTPLGVSVHGNIAQTHGCFAAIFPTFPSTNRMDSMRKQAGMNRQITLASRPKGKPGRENFKLVEAAVPEPQDTQVLLETLYLSLDPYMRGRMSEGPSYAEPVKLGDVMVGGTVSRVVRSRHSKFKEGELVLSFSGWQDYALSDGRDLVPLGDMQHPSYALGVLGMPGFTAYMGLVDIGQPKAGETLVVAAASGAVGSVVGQVGKILGCRVVGIAGSEDKCRFVKEELGFDECLNHRDEKLAEVLASACPQGIDIYFENVGGKVFEAVLPLLNAKARIPVCGLIADYNRTSLPEGPDRSGLLMSLILRKRLRMQGFIIMMDYGHRFQEFKQPMEQWLREGRVKYREDVVEGLEKAPEAFMGLLEGANFGKLVVKV